jgi:hypothetical protein
MLEEYFPGLADMDLNRSNSVDYMGGVTNSRDSAADIYALSILVCFLEKAATLASPIASILSENFSIIIV